MEPGARPSSPSGVSTTSSESPLVRQGSSASSISSTSSKSAASSTLSAATGAPTSAPSSRASSRLAAGGPRRFEPTCIAAAQLRLHELEGQQHLSAPTADTKLPNGNKLAQIGAAAKYTSNKNHDSANRKENKCQQQAAPNSKSFGYNVAKAFAFRANRLGNFWSMNKMRYMNLACLLMTLVCLLTILLVSNNNGNSIDRSGQSGRWQQRPTDNGTPVEAAESLEADRQQQPLVGRPKLGDDGELESGSVLVTSEPDLFDDRLEPEPNAGFGSTGTKLTAKPPASGLDTATSSHADANQDKDDESLEALGGRLGSFATRLQPVQGLSGLLLDRMFDDFDRGLGGLLAKSAANQRHLAESANSSRPQTIIRRVIRNGHGGGIDGETIIITTSTSGSLVGGQAKNGSSSSNATSSEDAAAAQAIPMLLERLIPPLLRPLGMMGRGVSGPLMGLLPPRRPSGGIMMSTFGSGQPMMLSRGGSALYAIPPPSLSPYGIQQMTLGAEPAPFVSMSGGLMAGPPPPPFFPSPGLFSAIMQQIAQRPAAFKPIIDEDLDDIGPKQKSRSQQVQPPTSGLQTNQSGPIIGVSTGKLEDPIQGQATDQTDSAKSGANSASSDSHNPDDDFETFDVTANRAAPPPPPTASGSAKSARRPLNGGASMIVISSSHISPELPHLMGPLAASMGHPSILGLNSMGPGIAATSEPERLGGSLSAGPVRPIGASPILRAILGNLMSDLSGGPPSSSSDAASQQSVERNLSRGRLASRRNSSFGWPIMGGDLFHELDDSDEDLMQPHQDAEEQHDQRRREPRGRQGEVIPGSNQPDQNQQPDAESSQPRVSFAHFMNGVANRRKPLHQVDRAAGSLVDQLIESAANGAHGSGSVRQIFRGDPISLDRVIELPGFEEVHGHQEQHQQHYKNPLDGVRSQSISRASHVTEPDMDDTEEIRGDVSGRMPAFQHQSPKRIPFARIVFGEDSSEQAQPQAPAVSLIGRLLDDLRQGSPTPRQHESDQQQASSRVAIKFTSKPQSGDLDEGDSMDLGATKEHPMEARIQHQPTGPWLPSRVRVATARIRISPMAAHRREMVSPLPSPERPSHAPAEALQPSPSASLLTGDNQKQPVIAGHHQEELNGSEITGLVSDHQLKHADQRQDEEDEFDQEELQMPKKEKISQQMKTIQQPNSPFTSPSSPLFGFPFMMPTELKPDKLSLADKAIAGPGSNADPKEQQPVTTPQGSNRRQRAFVYHSNHEIASSLSAPGGMQSRSNDHQIQQQSQSNAKGRFEHDQATSESINGPRFVLPPPAAIVMGRRLDDGPFAASDNQESGNPMD